MPRSTFNSGGAECPYCHYVAGDCWEWVKGSTVETVCDECKKPFSVEPDYSVIYRSFVTVPPASQPLIETHEGPEGDL